MCCGPAEKVEVDPLVALLPLPPPHLSGSVRPTVQGILNKQPLTQPIKYEPELRWCHDFRTLLKVFLTSDHAK